MDYDETIEIVQYYLDLATQGLPPETRLIATDIHIAILDGDVRPDRYYIKEEVVGEELYAKLLAYASSP